MVEEEDVQRVIQQVRKLLRTDNGTSHAGRVLLRQVSSLLVTSSMSAPLEGREKV